MRQKNTLGWVIFVHLQCSHTHSDFHTTICNCFLKQVLSNVLLLIGQKWSTRLCLIRRRNQLIIFVFWCRFKHFVELKSLNFQFSFVPRRTVTHPLRFSGIKECTGFQILEEKTLRILPF